jgi:kynureninase
MIIDRDYLQSLDRTDPLAGFRAEFDIPEDVIYLDGNSLGVMPAEAPARLRRTLRAWHDDLVTAWNTADWITLPERIGARIARLIGAREDEVVCTDSTSVNLFKLAATALQMQPGRHIILTERGNFPTDVYILEGLSKLVGPKGDLRVVEREQILASLDESVAVLALTHVHYKTAEMYDMAAVTRAAHEKGVLVVWDLSHSTGAVEVDLNGCDADFAVGCGYKYLNGGPGAPAYLFVAKRHHRHARQPLSGWLGHRSPFAFADNYQPAPGIGRFLCGAQPVLAMMPLESSLEIFDRVSMREVRTKSLHMRAILLQLLKLRCARYGFEFEPDIGEANRGSHISIMHAESYAICQALIHRRVIGDFRAPDALRLGITPLYLRYVDLWDAVEHLVQVMERREWDTEAARLRHAVT